MLLTVSIHEMYVILLSVIVLGPLPILAGWLSPRPWVTIFFPVGMLVSFTMALVTDGSFSYDYHPVGFIVMLTVIYGGITSLTFTVGRVIRECYLRIKVHRTTQ